MPQLGDRQVSDHMFRVAQDAKRGGGKVFLTTPEVISDLVSWSTKYKGAYCDNCNGAGSLGLQVLVGGPYNSPPSITWSNGQEPGKPAEPRATTIDGKWYKQKTREYACPVCGGTGSADARHLQPMKEIRL